MSEAQTSQSASADTAANGPVDTDVVYAPWKTILPRERRRVLNVLFVVGVFNYADRTLLSVLLEPIKAEFNASDAALGLLTGLAFALLYATLGVPVARWSDRTDRPRIIAGMLAIWSLMSIFCGLASSFWQLALARVGVGAGEAGAVPASQSLIGDVYPPAERVKALSIYMLSPTIGLLIATMCGPWIAEHYGWRAAFIAISAPGLLLAIIVMAFLREPRLKSFVASTEPLGAALRALWMQSTYRGIVVAMVLYFFLSYGAFVFFPSFLVRTHGLSLSQAGIMFGVSNAIGGLAGTYLIGVLAAHISRTDPRWLLRLPALCVFATFPVLVAFLSISSIPGLWATLLLASALLGGAIPPIFAALHLVCGAHRRATAVAIMFLFANLLGLGLGPLITGGLSDFFAAGRDAAEGLQIALLATLTLFIPCGLVLWRSAARIESEMER